MKQVGITAAVLAITCAASCFAQQKIKRQILQETEVPSTNYKTVLFSAELPAHTNTGLHTHPGIEVGMVLDGTGEIKVQGGASLPLKAGGSYQLANGIAHDVCNTGKKPLKLIATWVIDKDKPMSTKAE